MAGVTVASVATLLESWIPLDLSESWDNTGLLLGDRRGSVASVMTCLTLTATTVSEAIEKRADLVISHHPLPFKPLAKITTDTQTGDLLWQLARAGVSVYSPHTAWDSSRDGINEQLALKLQLEDVQPLIPAVPKGATSSSVPEAPRGAGRMGRLASPIDIHELARRTSSVVPYCRPRGVPAARPIRKIAIGCGSGGSFLSAAVAKGCDALLTGEATFHDCLAAEYAGTGLLMIGHFASERFAMEVLADRLHAALPDLTIWAAAKEADPVVTL
ncbi:MAG: Nif3-like dinuclear metal center hexameric protein [Pirellulales bacterium]